ncbi:MAG: DUF1638 domain-containing protein [Alphaproteobacteria bacterium]|jgi:hypothetical protein|nr:DUF1638 domain-containing protein [Alphaproteobacteria bacterium]
MTVEPPRTLLITCGALAGEIVALVRDNGWDSMKVKCLPAHIHNTPEHIPDGVRRLIHAGREDFEQILVLFADCGTGGKLDEVLAEEDVVRVGGSHCYEVYAGPEAYAEMMQNEPGSFFLTDFLARHFDRLIIQGLALDRHPKLRDIYFGKYRKLVYLSQNEAPDLRARAEAAAERLGLAFEERRTGYGGYREFLKTHQA